MKRLLTILIAFAMVATSMIMVPFNVANAASYATPTLVSWNVDSFSHVSDGYTIHVSYTVHFDNADHDKPFIIQVKGDGYGYKCGSIQVVKTVVETTTGYAPPFEGDYTGEATITVTDSEHPVKYVYLYLVDGGSGNVLNSDPLKVGHVYVASQDFWVVYKGTNYMIGPVTITDEVNGKHVTGGTIELVDPANNHYNVTQVAEDGSFAFSFYYKYEGKYTLIYNDGHGYSKGIGHILVKGHFNLNQPKDGVSVEPIRQKALQGDANPVAVYTFDGSLIGKNEADHPDQVKVAYQDVFGHWHTLGYINLANDGSFAKRFAIPGYAVKVDMSAYHGSSNNWTGRVYYPYPAIKVDAPDANVTMLTSKLYKADLYNGTSQYVMVKIAAADGYPFIGSAQLNYTWYEYAPDECNVYGWKEYTTNTTVLVSGKYAFIPVPNDIINNLGSVKLVLNYLIDDKVRYDLSQDEFILPVVYPKGITLNVDYGTEVGDGEITVTAKVLNINEATSDYQIELYGAYVEVPSYTSIDLDKIGDINSPSDLVNADNPNNPCNGYLLGTFSAADGINYTIPYTFREGGNLKLVFYVRVKRGADVIYENSFMGEDFVFGYQIEGAEDVTVGQKADLKVRVFDPADNTPINNAKIVLTAYDHDGNPIAFSNMFPGCRYNYLVIDTDDLNGNIVNGVYDFTKKYKGCDFTAALAGKIKATVTVGGDTMVLDVPVMEINPIEDIHLTVEALGDVVPGEPVQVKLSYPASDGVGAAYLKYIGLSGMARFLSPISGLYANDYVVAPAGTKFHMEGDNYVLYVSMVPGQSSMDFYVATKEWNHMGVATFEVKGVDVALKDLVTDKETATLTDGLYYEYAYALTYNNDEYDATKVILKASEFACSTVRKVDFYDAGENIYSGGVITTYPSAGKGEFDFHPVLNHAASAKAYVYVFKDDIIVGIRPVVITEPNIYIIQNDENKPADGSVLVGYVNADTKVAIYAERAEGGPIAGAGVALSKVTGVNVIGRTGDDGIFSTVIHPLGQGLLEISVSKDMGSYVGYALVGYDSGAPIIEIIQPEFTSTDTYVADKIVSKVKIVGKVYDKETKVVKVLVNGQSVPLIGDQFMAEVTVQPGENIVNIIAQDEAGNISTYKFLVNVPVDDKAPVVTVVSPKVNELGTAETDQKKVTIVGNVSDEGTGVDKVYVNDAVVPVIGDTFTYVADLAEGVNTFTIVAYDKAGNMSEPVTINVVYDPMLGKTVVELAVGSQFYKVNGETKIMDTAPFIDENNRMMVPVRFVAEALGLGVQWDSEKRQVIIKGEDKEVVLTVDSSIAYVDGTPIKLDTKAVIVNGRTFVPVRFVAEAFGFEVQWQPPVVVLVKVAD